jgi:hypothetical protein
MMDTTQKMLKKRIVAIVRRSGLPISTDYITEQVVMPEGVMLNDVLTELVAEGRLFRGCTLLVNGEASYTYDLAIETTRP